ncbi:hypothetical protein K492DRAFT_195406 [Lichtheimia hyalospora FSU 10163]|nr:hypothetical protein K492DRAFT_195406 [Lichtheimia hyalospora FSU 10163]
MKNTGILLAIISASTGLGALADIALLEPWANTTWLSGGKGTIRWKSEASESNMLCDIQLMNGNSSDGQMVAYVTDPHSPVSCTSNSYTVSPLNDLSEGVIGFALAQRVAGRTHTNSNSMVQVNTCCHSSIQSKKCFQLTSFTQQNYIGFFHD